MLEWLSAIVRASFTFVCSALKVSAGSAHHTPKIQNLYNTVSSASATSEQSCGKAPCSMQGMHRPKKRESLLTSKACPHSNRIAVYANQLLQFSAPRLVCCKTSDDIL